MRMSEISHPVFDLDENDWRKYRSVYNGGKQFVNEWLRKFSVRESEADFCRRKDISYAPSFAKAAINEIKNVIFNRLRDVTRKTESNTYNQCIQGKLRGVDNGGATMDYFIGQYVIPELLTMRKVGVYVDMPYDVPKTLIGTSNIHPYLYLYKAEQIRSWTYADSSNPKEFQSVLLYEDQLQYDSECNLPIGNIARYRHVYLNDQGTVNVDFYGLDDKPINRDGVEEDITYTLDIKEIPLVIFEISDSLLKDVADYQIALLNMESADIMYAITSNFTLYVEEGDDEINKADDIPEYDDQTNPTEALIVAAKENSAKVGPTYGKIYPKGTNPPAFIHPSPEPLQAAMDKEKQIKKDIKLLVNLAINDLNDKMASEASKQIDESGKQTGLSCIAYVLENCEKKIATYWGAYESKSEDSVLVNYPKDYDLKSDTQRMKDAMDLWESIERIPSNTFKKEILKRIITVLLNDKVTSEIIKVMYKEIDDAKGLITTVDLLLQSVEAGTCDKETASILSGFAKGVAAKAETEHAAELAKIQASQGGQGGSARGVGATQTNQPTSSDEKKGKPKRGSAK